MSETNEEAVWTPEELTEFDRLTWESCSSNQVERIFGRLEMKKFIEAHGKEKCDAMWSHLMGKENKKP